MNNSEVKTDDNYLPAGSSSEEPMSKNYLARIDLTGALRHAGAIAVLIALYSLLSKGWAGGNDLFKYIMLLGSTVGISFIALVTAKLLKEGKGPRLLITLGLVSVPVNFAILGAFIYYGASDSIGKAYPSYAAWTVESLSTALILAVIATALLLPIIWLGFRTLARGMSQRMTGFFLLSNLLLLVPFRDPILVASMAIALGVLSVFISARTVRQQVEIKTPEGRLALLIQFIPLGILVGRNIWLYAADEIVVFSALAMTFIGLRQISFLTQHSLARGLLNLLSLITAIGTGFMAVSVTGNLGLDFAGSALLGTLITSGLSYEMSLRPKLSQANYRSVALGLLVLGCILNLSITGAFAISIATLVIGVTLLASSYIFEQRALSLAGITLVLVGLVDQIFRAMHWFDMGSWIALLTMGVSAIVIASILDTKGEKLRILIRRYKKQFNNWEY